MKKQPEVRYFPIPKSLKEMTPEERREYATQLMDHMLKQAQEEIEISQKSRVKKVAVAIFRLVGLLLAGFFYLASILQFQDQFVGYGFVSIGLGTLFILLVFNRQLIKSFQEWRNPQ